MSSVAYDEIVVKKDTCITKASFDEPNERIALLAILNSSLMSFLYLSSSTAAGDDFRRATLSGLRELLIVTPDAKAMVDLERRIDAIMYRTYGATGAEREATAKWLAKPG
jgi:hypothetical protein